MYIKIVIVITLSTHLQSFKPFTNQVDQAGTAACAKRNVITLTLISWFVECYQCILLLSMSIQLTVHKARQAACFDAKANAKGHVARSC